MDEILTAANVVNTALPLLRSSSRAFSQPSIDTTKSASASDGKLGCEPGPVMEPQDVALPPSRSSLEMSSRRSSCSVASGASVSSEKSFRYHPVPAKEWEGIYPPVIPPPDFFDLEEEERKIKEDMFKKDNMGENYLYDETGKVNLPVDEKGVLILDPVSRTKIIDVEVENYILDGYYSWLDSAKVEVEELGGEQSVDWLRGLQEAVGEDFNTVDDERLAVMDEERNKRGLTDWETHMLWWSSTGRELWAMRNNDEQGDIETGDSDGSQQGNHSQSTTTASDDHHTTKEEISPVPLETATTGENLSPTSPLPSSPVEFTTISEPSSPTAPPLNLFTFWS